MSKRKAATTHSGFMGILIILTWLILTTVWAEAGTTKYTVGTYYISYEVLPVGGTGGHILGTFSSL